MSPNHPTETEHIRGPDGVADMRRRHVLTGARRHDRSMKLLECSARAGESPVVAGSWRWRMIPSTTVLVKDRGKLGGPPPKTTDHPSPIAKSTVRER